MNKILVIEQKKERTLEEQRALGLHRQFEMHKQMAGMGLAGMCADLHEIKRTRAYEALGFASLGEYTEQAHGIKERQAYKYIRVYERLGLEVLHSNANIGVTKLLELASLDKDEREDLLAAHSSEEMEEMNVEEFSKVVEENRKLREQLSFLENEPKETIIQKVVDNEAIAKAEELMQRKMDEEIARIKKAQEEKTKAAEAKNKDLAEKLKKAETETKNAQQELTALKEEKAEIEKGKAELAQAREMVERAQKEKEALEKAVKVANDPEMVRFKFLFEAWQKATATMMEQKDKLTEEQKVKVTNAIRKAMEVYGL